MVMRSPWKLLVDAATASAENIIMKQCGPTVVWKSEN